MADWPDVAASAEPSSMERVSDVSSWELSGQAMDPLIIVSIVIFIGGVWGSVIISGLMKARTPL